MAVSSSIPHAIERAAPIETAAKAPAGRLPLLAFVADSASEAAIIECVGQMSLNNFRVVRGGIGKAIQHLDAERSPAILIVDISDADLPVSRVHELAEVCEPAVTVIAVGNDNDVALYRDLIAAGITEYIVKPVTPQLLVRALAGRPERGGPGAISQKLGKLVACIGARGGVGTTTIAVGLAWYLANQQSRRVALLDLDLQHGACALALNMRPTAGLREALVNPGRIDPIFIERITAMNGERLAVLSGEEPLRDDVQFTAEAVQTAIAVLRAQSHYVIVDIPRTPGAPYRWVLDAADFRVIVADQSLQAGRDAARLRGALVGEATEHRNLLVVNRGGEGGRHAISLKEMEQVLELRPNVVVPYEPIVFTKAINTGKPPGAGRGRFAESMAALTREISGRSTQRRSWWKSRR
jgi:pilus assembly protein CpaE